jgi:Ion channel
VVTLLKREPSAILFVSQIAALLVYPFMEGEAGRAFISVLGIAFLGLVVLAVRSSPAFTWIGLLLAGPAAVLLLIEAITNSDTLLPYSAALEAVLYFYAAGALIAYMLADHVITRDELWAVGATFTLVAWGFAYAYTVCQAAVPDSFGEHRTWVELLFLSFTTLSSTGLSDITPARPFARSLNMLEQLAGLAYVAMVVSRLIGLLVRSPGLERGDRDEAGTPPTDSSSRA